MILLFKMYFVILHPRIFKITCITFKKQTLCFVRISILVCVIFYSSIMALNSCVQWVETDCIDGIWVVSETQLLLLAVEK